MPTTTVTSSPSEETQHYKAGATQALIHSLTECTIDGDDADLTSCDDLADSQCYEVGDGIDIKVEEVQNSGLTNGNTMTWTAVFTPICP